jgi:cullin 1
MNCFDPSTDPKLMRCLVDALLTQVRAEDLLTRPNSGVMHLLNDGKHEDIKRMYTLFNKEGATQHLLPMSKIFEEYVIAEGKKLLDIRRNEAEVSADKSDKKDKKEAGVDGTKLIVEFMALHDKVNAFVEGPFDENILFQRSMTYGFQKIFNEDASPTVSNVEHLSAYVDSVLRGKEGSEKLDEATIQTKLEHSVQLFNYVTDKDVYKELYKVYLSKRLLNNKVASMDMEKHMITLLKLAQGTPFTQLIESMITDFDLVKDGKVEFKNFLDENPSILTSTSSSSSSLSSSVVERPCEPNILLLTREFWPTQAGIDGLQLPDCLKKIVGAYENFFQEKHGGKKKLHWKYTLGDAEVAGYFPTNTYFMSVSTLQALALYHIGTVGKISASGMADVLNIDIEYVKRVLHSLSCGKLKVLLKEGPGGKKVDPTDQFEVNKKFKSSKIKFSIPMASLNFSDDIKKKVKEDRTVMIDAAIVRIMKARKRMAHSALVSEVLQQLNQFQPETSVVKKCIAALIEREYLERNETSDGTFTNEYNYLA